MSKLGTWMDEDANLYVAGTLELDEVCSRAENYLLHGDVAGDYTREEVRVVLADLSHTVPVWWNADAITEDDLEIIPSGMIHNEPVEGWEPVFKVSV